jgi:transcriptional regulator with XRE-family HTH domain
MNIEIANRLYEYRKQNSLSQEELAARIGVSRQAVSKWERAESSPDTDNLIELARLYGVSLDDLLFTDEPITKKEAEPEPEEEKEPESYVHVSFKDGIHVKDGGDEVHVSFRDGIHVKSTDNEEVHVSFKDGIQVLNDGVFEFDSRTWTDSLRRKWYYAVPIPLLAVAAYLVLGFVHGMWHPGWLVAFAIPVYYELCSMVSARGLRSKLNHFPISTLCVPAYLSLGFFYGLWHPGWIIFLAIPVYYSLVNTLVRK